MKIRMRSLLNILVRGGIGLSILAVGLVACEDWWGDDDHFNLKGDVYADHLDTPWEMNFAPDGRLFFTQRPGSVAVVENGETKIWLALDSAAVEIGESGVLGITLHPDFQPEWIRICRIYLCANQIATKIN